MRSPMQNRMLAEGSHALPRASIACVDEPHITVYLYRGLPLISKKGTPKMAREKMLRLRPQPISLRLHAGQRDRIWGLAQIEGRTLNDMVCGLLDLAMMRADEGFGSYQGHVVARALLAAAEAAVARHGADKGMWLYDPGFFQLARAAIDQVLDLLDPTGNPQLHEHLAELDRRKQVEIDRRTQARTQAELDRQAEIEQTRKRQAAGGARG